MFKENFTVRSSVWLYCFVSSRVMSESCGESMDWQDFSVPIALYSLADPTRSGLRVVCSRGSRHRAGPGRPVVVLVQNTAPLLLRGQASFPRLLFLHDQLVFPAGAFLPSRPHQPTRENERERSGWVFVPSPYCCCSASRASGCDWHILRTRRHGPKHCARAPREGGRETL